MATKSPEEKAHDAYVKALSKAGKKNLAMLEKADVELTGAETEAELEELVAANGLGAGDSEEEVIDGVPNNLPQQFESAMVNNKEVRYPMYFIAAVEGGTALYNEKGRRVSPVMSAAKVFGRPADDARGHDIKTKEVGEVSEHAHIAKACASSNALRRARRLPNDPVQ